MVSAYQIPHLILCIFMFILFLNTKLLMVDSLENADGPSLYWKEIKKVSGDDGSDENKSMFIEKFRVLLGLKSFNIRSRHGHTHHGDFAPAPAPSNGVEVPAPAPTPAPAAHSHVHSHRHHPRPKLSPIPLHHDFEQGHGNKVRHKIIVIAVAVSSAAASVITILGLSLLCWKFKRSRQRRSMVKISVCGVDGECRGSKYVNSSHSKSKVSFDLGPEHFYLNSLEPIPESNASSFKHTYETENMSSGENQMIISSDEKSGSTRGSSPSQSVEEFVHVHEVRDIREIDDSSCLLASKLVPDEPLSSEDESFHSVCCSHSSNDRISNASDGDLGNPTDVCPPLSYPNVSSSDHSITHLCRSPWKKTAAPQLTPDPIPPLKSSFKTSPNHKLSSNDLIIPVHPQVSPHQTPPPPPPPPPPVYSSHFTSTSTIPKISSTRNKSCSGSNSSQQELSQHATKQASATKPLTTPPSPPIPPSAPPPPFKGGSKSALPPPPPPGQLPHYLPVGKDGAPLPKLKPLHWDKVRAAPDCSMIWDKLRSSSFELDEKMIESLFGYNMQIKNEEVRSKSPSPNKHVLEPKRLQNITILSKALNATPKQVCDALMQGEGLCLQQLEVLGKMVPTKEEETELLNYQGDINELDFAEKFVKAMLNIPFAFPRIEAMLYRDTFEDEVIHLQKSFAMLEDACNELRSSRLFLKLLEAVLKTGNRMNVGTIRGGARAFKLDALLKLADIKGTDGKTTLLHFVVQEMIRSEGIRESEIITNKSSQRTQNKTTEEREEDYRRLGLDLVSGLTTELCNVKKTATIDLDVIASSVSNLSDGMLKLQHLVNDVSPLEHDGHFVQSMRSFLDNAEKHIRVLQRDEDRVLLHVKEITEYFHGHVSKDEVNPLRIFVIVRDFLAMLEQVCKEVRMLKVTHTPSSIAPFR